RRIREIKISEKTMRKKIIIGSLILIALFLGSSSIFAVDWTEYIYLTQFGRPVATFDGENEAGLHFKWPWPVQSIQRFDRRIHMFDLPATELLTRDPKGNTIDRTLAIAAYASWRIAGATGVDRFIRTVGTPENAETILAQRINSQLGSEIGRMRLEDLINDSADGQVSQRL